ncbi:hypothetical protein PHYBOEH_004593 [Phytophthora boehmeriae]|uniref:RxLR effector protein n=1 Tax=Phytophthora boehmeriae TaxID=109152 RepID=A0A8T1WLS6_9STRA|nr:hypothetical protein PHYBOEH_004593 [Phytophthora boehmeriae]
MRLSYLILVSVAALIGSCSGIAAATPAVDSHKLARLADTKPSPRFLRTSKIEDDDEERAFLGFGKVKVKDDFSVKRLNKMLSKETYKNTKFVKWKGDDLSPGAVYTKLNLKDNPHFETLYHQYFQFRNPGL